jgi:hypothetical protein
MEYDERCLLIYTYICIYLFIVPPSVGGYIELCYSESAVKAVFQLAVGFVPES